MAVLRERALQTVTNYFIVSLAIADLLVAVVVMPFGVYILVSTKSITFILPPPPLLTSFHNFDLNGHYREEREKEQKNQKFK